jgi:hypothetical protein
MAFRLLKAIDGWLWVVAILGLARDRFARPRRLAPPASTQTSTVRRLGAHLNDAVLPFYVLHETVVVVIASFILTWKLAPGAQYLLISIASLVTTVLLCEFGVRRSPVTRVLFGLKPRRNALITPPLLSGVQVAPCEPLTAFRRGPGRLLMYGCQRSRAR